MKLKLWKRPSILIVLAGIFFLSISNPMFGATPPAIGKMIALKCVSNNFYVCSENGTVAMNCNRPTIEVWEQFLVVDAGSGKIALAGEADGVATSKYVCSENGGAAMICNRPSIGPWEQFDWVDNGDGTISLRGSNGKYATGSSPMWCTGTSISTAQKFQMTDLSPQEDPAIPQTLPVSEVRQSSCLNGIWNFTPDGGSATQIQVPASWDRNSDTTSNYYVSFKYPNSWTGGTYSRGLSVPSGMSGKVIKLAFGSVRFVSEVKVNGTVVGTNSDGFLPFEYKINSQITGNDTITVKINPENVAPKGLNGGYAENRGIWQDVYLKAYPLVYVDNTFFVKTSYRNKLITTDVPVKNEDIRARTFYIRNFVTDLNNNIVLTFDSGWQTLAANSSQTYTFSKSWTNPHYWIPEDPYLYNIHTVIYDTDKTTVVDWKKTRFGFREFYLSGSQFYLNGMKAFLRGDSHHYQAEYQQTRDYYVALFTAMKEWGCNYFRPHTLPYDPLVYDVADEMGMMVIAESAVYGSDGDDTGYYPDHLRRFIERDRNHPSIVLWSVSNEVIWNGGNPEPHRALAAFIDPSRIAYAEENGYEGPQVCGVHYFDFDHSGLYTTLPNPPVINPNKVHMMGEYSNYTIAAFGDTGVGACGYETNSQDYGTGYWTHGETAQGQTKALQIQRLYGGYCSWSIHWFACRNIPFFNGVGKDLTWTDLTTPGAKPQKVNPNQHAINWVDPNLPLYNPLSWFYLYVPYYQAVRCTDLMPDSTVKNRNYYSGSTITRNFDLWYESFQPANHMKLEIVRKSDGAVLYSNDLTGAPWNNIQPGETYTNLSVNWTAPTVTSQTPVKINRSFYYNTTCVNTCSFEGNIFPRFTTGNLPNLSGKRIALYDPAGSTKSILDNIGVSYTLVSGLSSVTYSSYDLLIIGSQNATTGLSASFVANGGRVLCLRQTATPSLPINLPSVVSGSQKDLQFLLNGPKHKVFDGLDQNDLSYWANNVNTAQNVFNRPTVSENIRVLLAANNDGDYAPILEVPAGQGTYLLSQMEIVPQYNNEPVAGKLLVNMLNYLGGYTPVVKAKTGLIAGSGAIKSYYDELGLRYTLLDAGNLPDLAPYMLLIVDGTSTTIATSLSSSANVTKLNDFVTNGGKIMVNQINNNTIPNFSQVINQFSLSLRTPAEKNRSVKCAVSWRHKNTPNDPVRYGYLNIPQPFEMNPDELLAGLNNKDLDWTATQLNYAIKITGKTYPDVNELIAPYRIDWNYLESDRGEFSSPVIRSKYQDGWFLNREPVLLKLKQGNGFWVINELLLENDAVKGKRVGNLLLTNLGASVGSTDTYYNLNYSIIPPTYVFTPPPGYGSSSGSGGSGSQAYLQASDGDGIVSIETEHFSGNNIYTYAAQGGTQWDKSSTVTGYSSEGYMKANNDLEQSYPTNYVGRSPRLDYNINFVKTGTHYVWIRGNAQGSANDDSFHVGIDGNPVTTAEKITLNGAASWAWTKLVEGGSVATINVNSTGTHLINIWANDDGVIIDKIVLTVNPAYTVTGTGPAESPTGSTEPPPSEITLFSTGLESGQTSPTWSDTIEYSTNVSGYLPGINPECGIRNNETAHTGSSALMFSGTDNSAATSYCYYKVFDVNIPIASSTKLSYWSYPQNENARYVAVDFICTDGTTLRDSGATTTSGVSIHPAVAKGAINTWNQIQCNVGQWLNGKTIDRILVAYDQGPATGQYRGYIDDIAITSTTPVIVLRAGANGKYVCADNAGNSALIANSASIIDWVKFDRIDNTDGTVSFKSKANGKYVCADNGGANPLIANRDAIGLWEKFTIVDAGSGNIALKASANNKYVCADNSGNNPLIANRDTVGPWETFTMITQ